ncbi:MAG: cysteine hydrolase [Actinobacteria bacterium]|nr:cysteine hydrolase [Actinomycetota bacterium]
MTPDGEKHMTDVTVVLVDVQHDFLDPKSSDVGSWEKAFCVPGIERLLTFARVRGWPVIHVGTKHESVETLPTRQHDRGIKLYCKDGSPGSEFVLDQEVEDRLVFKSWYSALRSPLKDLLPAAGTVMWTGVATDCCILQSAFDADHLGLRNVVPIQAVSASSAEGFSSSLEALAKSAAAIVDLDKILAGQALTDCEVEVGDVSDRARRWFSEQKELLGDSDGHDLQEVLSRLRADGAL